MVYFRGIIPKWPHFRLVNHHNLPMIEWISDSLTIHTIVATSLVGGLEHGFYFSIQLGSWECHHPIWLIFFRGVGSTTNHCRFRNSLPIDFPYRSHGAENGPAGEGWTISLRCSVYSWHSGKMGRAGSETCRSLARYLWEMVVQCEVSCHG